MDSLFVVQAKPLPVNRYKRAIWLLMEYPESSVAARVVALWSVVIILLSVIVFCVETIPGLGKLRPYTVCAWTLVYMQLDNSAEY